MSRFSTERLLVPEESDGMRADIFLAAHVGSRSAAQKILATAGIAKNYRLRAGEVLSLQIAPRAPISDIKPESIPLDIVYEDSHLLVINKPRGLVVHPGAGNLSGTLVNALLAHCEIAGGDPARPGIVHRLDKDTSGLLVAAKTEAAHAHLSAQLAARTMHRRYAGIILGHPKEDAFTISENIARHRKERVKMAVVRPPQGRTATTHITVADKFTRRGKFARIQARLETGRTHQIRVHMAHIGHPILGDTTYGPKKPPLGICAQVLHAEKLAFTHPFSGEDMQFEAALPPYFLEVLAVL
jgi:23S rRNA pseudouridine1911/1915/1917 synthase